RPAGGGQVGRRKRTRPAARLQEGRTRGIDDEDGLAHLGSDLGTGGSFRPSIVGRTGSPRAHARRGPARESHSGGKSSTPNRPSRGRTRRLTTARIVGPATPP